MFGKKRGNKRDVTNFASYEILKQFGKRWYNLDPDVRLWFLYCFSEQIEEIINAMDEMLSICEETSMEVTEDKEGAIPSDGTFKVNHELTSALVMEALEDSKLFKKKS